MYRIESKLHTVEGIIEPTWAKSLSVNRRDINAVNYDWRDIQIIDNVQLSRMGGMTVQCTRRLLRKQELNRVRNLGERVDLTLGASPLRLVSQEDMLGAAEQYDDILFGQLEKIFDYPRSNDSWILPEVAIEI